VDARNLPLGEIGRRSKISSLNSYHISCFSGLVVIFLSGWLLNRYLFPIFDQINPSARECFTGCGGLTLMVVALIATFRPHILSAKSLLVGTLGCSIIGAVSIIYAMGTPLEGPLIAGPLVWAVGERLFAVIAGIACIHMTPRATGLCIALAYAFSYALRSCLMLLPDEACIAIYMLILPVVTWIVFPFARNILASAFESESPANCAITKPSSLLPLNSQLFIALLVFAVIYGYALTWGESDRIPSFTAETVAVPIIVAAVALFHKKALDPDALFIIAVLLVLAGFLIALMPELGSFVSSNMFLNSGSALFDILTYVVLIALGSRNQRGSVAMFAWGASLSAFGVVIGAQLGRFANNNGNSTVLSAVMIFVFMAYVLISTRLFSFKSTVESVTSTENIKIPVSLDDLDNECSSMSKEFGLTKREQEALVLLAHGRNSRFIQEEMTVSYNTAKSHVKHVYMKLDVHSQQELIDLAESRLRQIPKAYPADSNSHAAL
jgi:DNA-binding CsgD family transcriptional regulator